MDRSKKIEQFPDVDKKLAASAKKSLFEQQRAEAEAKRIREEKETAAVYASFVASFDDEEEAPQQGGYGQGGYGGGQGGFAQPKRHYGPPTGPAAGRGFLPQRAGLTGPPRSGPGSLGPALHTVPRSGPGSLGAAPHHERGSYNPGPGYGTPRGFQQPPQRQGDRRSFASDDYDHTLPPQHATRGPKVPAAFSTSDDEDEAADSGWRAAEPPVPKPTIQMSNLPPGTSPAAIKALLPSNLIVEAVRILPPPPSGPNNTERKSMSAIVTLSKETAASDIDSTVSQLRDKYLGWGFYLSLSRGLSSAALDSSSLTHLPKSSSTNFQPFGAKVADLSQPAPSSRMNQHAPPTSYKGIAPPASYHTPAVPKPSGRVLVVEVKPPGDIKEIRLIHKTLENLLTYGPEFEALLMTRPDVQREEKWAWLFNARSTGGVYYRWRLFSLLSGTEAKGRYVPVFEDSAAWKTPKKPLPFEYTTHLDEFVEDEHYISTDGSDSESERRQPTGLGLGEEGPSFLGQMQKAHFTHLLARLPSNVQKLRRGDVARVSAFALRNAKRGAPEVVEMVVENVLHPYSASGANREYKKSSRPVSRDGARGEGEEKVEDTSAASLVGLRLIPDIIAAALNSGVSNARVYRQLFEDAIRKRKVFEYVAKLDRKYGWGRMSFEKWKSVVKGELGRWKDSCMFMPGAPEGWLEIFCNPPISKEEEERERVKEEARVKKEKESRWKAVREREMADREGAERADAEMEDVDGAPMAEHDDVDGVPMEEEDVDGVPMVDSDDDVDREALAMDEDEPVQASAPPSVPDNEKGGEETRGERVESGGLKTGFKIEGKGENVRTVRKRPRAEDMFADSDEDEKHPSAS